MTGGTGPAGGGGPDPVERYLDELYAGLRGDPARCRRLLAETESHLLDAVDAGLARGLSRDRAAAAAVAEFGPPSALVGPAPSALATAARLLRPLVRTGSGVLAAGLLTAGAAGLLGWLVRLGFGDRFLAGDQPGVQYSAHRCADFFEYAPRAASCLDAAASHHADEVVGNGVSLGVLGLLVLAAHLWLRRRWRPAGPELALPVGFGAAVAGTMFIAIGAVAWLSAVSSIGIGRIDGGGQYLGTAVACTVAAALFVRHWLRAVARPVVVVPPPGS